MADLLKDNYNYDTIKKLALDVQSVYPSFQVEAFLNTTLDDAWPDLELKARVERIVVVLGKFLPEDYIEATNILNEIVAGYEGLLGIIFPCFIEIYGQDEKYFDLSIKLLENYTQYSTAELAIRPFIIKQEEYMMKQMYEWSKHENEHVRRLASEGCRPQLPWAQAIESFKKDPSPIIPILEQLKNDSSLYVRRSVANNLNDISKTHPDLVISLAKEWYGNNKDTDWLVKHACRTLLKKGNKEILAIFGYHDSSSIIIKELTQDKKVVVRGEDITFSFTVTTKESTKIRLEYGVDFVKANGKRSRKIFQIAETALKENQEKSYIKKHSFKEITTRKHYLGTHSITLIINGIERDTFDFELIEKGL